MLWEMYVPPTANRESGEGLNQMLWEMYVPPTASGESGEGSTEYAGLFSHDHSRRRERCIVPAAVSLRTTLRRCICNQQSL